MTKITGFKHITVSGVDDTFAMFFNEGTIGLIHDVPHNVINNFLLQSSDSLSYMLSNPAGEAIHEELLFARILLIQCVAVGANSGYCCKEHCYIGTAPCSCGHADYTITNLTDPTV